MKNTKTLVKLAALAAVLAIPLVSQGATIVGTDHDLSSGGGSPYAGSSDQTCIYCHTPHNGLSTLVPLWNHPTTATATFTLYPSGGTLQATPGQPAGASKACLSCHDGTVAVNAHAAVGGGNPVMTGTPNLGTSLANDHPISFTYDAGLVASDTAANGGIAGLVTPAGGLAGGLPLFAGSLECASCHNVHDNTTAQPFLRVDNALSALCTKCHIK